MQKITLENIDSKNKVKKQRAGPTNHWKPKPSMKVKPNPKRQNDQEGIQSNPCSLLEKKIYDIVCTRI
jgi:hypothetical protein